jgi:hypothetical protein
MDTAGRLSGREPAIEAVEDKVEVEAEREFVGVDR